MKRYTALILALMWMGSAVAEAPIVETITGTARAIDGDTIKIGKTPIRLKGIAAPERSEAGGPEAKAFMSWILAGQDVHCDLTKERTWDRRVGFCEIAGIDLGELMVKTHMARPCLAYSRRYEALLDPGHDELPEPGYCKP